MNGHSGDQVDALRSLDPHDAKTVAKQLCYRIPESKARGRRTLGSRRSQSPKVR
ncbi:unnamed protein product [Durusdinium trenchii]|uniref:Uncharacterized protein n=1 Tax=Durusdinium trenchii TaxID=1381693 RepID=A0ABP0MQB3_9DINO